MGAADYEESGGIDVVLGVFVEQIGGKNGLVDVLEDVGAQIFIGDGFGVLRGDDDGIDADGLVGLRVVLDGDSGSCRRRGGRRAGLLRTGGQAAG